MTSEKPTQSGGKPAVGGANKMGQAGPGPKQGPSKNPKKFEGQSQPNAQARNTDQNQGKNNYPNKGQGGRNMDPHPQGPPRGAGGPNHSQNPGRNNNPKDFKKMENLTKEFSQVQFQPQPQRPQPAGPQPEKEELILMVTGLPGKMDFHILKEHLQEYASSVNGKVKFVKNGQGTF